MKTREEQDAIDAKLSELQALLMPNRAQVLEALDKLMLWEPEQGVPLPRETAASSRDKKVPFVSEAFLYALLGKEDARSLLAYLSRVCEALGLDWRARRARGWSL